MAVDVVLKKVQPIMPRGAQPSADEFIRSQQVTQDAIAAIIKYLQELSPGGEISHLSDVADVGANTHAQLDAHLAGTAKAQHAAGMGAHAHTASAAEGGQIDHTTALTNAGTNTHTQIDLHLSGSAVAKHALGVGAHSHETAGAQGSQLVHGSACTAASLALDSHSGYLWLTGRSGGQTAAGDTASGGSIIVKGTSHATAGPIQLNPAGGTVGIGTATAPHGGVGGGLLAIEGANASASAGPHAQFTTASDNYPLLQVLPYQHDDVNINLDCYFDGSTKASDTSAFAVVKTSDELRFAGNGSLTPGNAFSQTTRMAMDVNGRLWIGSTTPQSGVTVGKLQVSYATTANDYSAEFDSTGNGTTNRSGIAISVGSAASEGSQTYYVLDAYSGSTYTGTLKTVNGTFQLADVSDERVKTHLAPAKIDGLAAIMAMMPVEFSYARHGKPSADHMCGLTAQNVQKVFPEAVSPGRDGYLQLSKAELMPLVIKALQELLARFEVVERKVLGAR